MLLRFVTITLPVFMFFCVNVANAAPFITQLGEYTVVNSNQSNDGCSSVAVDGDKNVYCAGSTVRSGEPNGGGLDAYILKLSPNGNIVWLTQLGANTLAAPGGSNSNSTDDVCLDVTVDDLGNVYCVGTTLGSMSEPNAGGYDIFIMKLNANGNIVWHTQLGQTTKAVDDPLANTADDKCLSIAIDKQYNVYCAGSTRGFMSEANSALNTGWVANDDAIIIKLNSEGQLQWLKQFGLFTTATPTGSNYYPDVCNAIAIDDFNDIYCAGYTFSDMSETNSGNLPSANGRVSDGFVMKLNSVGELLWHTQFGADTAIFPTDTKDKGDECNDVRIGPGGLVYCSISNTSRASSYVVKLHPNTGAVFDSLNLGSFPERVCYRMDVDIAGNIYCTGGGRPGDLSMMKLDSVGSLMWQWNMTANWQLSNGTTGDSGESCADIAIDAAGNVYCAGATNGNLGELNANVADGSLSADMVVVGLLPDGSDTVPPPPANNPPIAEAGPAQSVSLYSLVTLDATGSSDPDNNVPLTYQWFVVSEPAGSNIVLSDLFSSTPTFTPSVVGQYTFQIIVRDNLGLSGAPDSVMVNASVVGSTSVIENNDNNATPLSEWILIHFSPDFIIPGPGQKWVLTADSNSSNGNAHVIKASADSGNASFAWRFIPSATDYYTIDAIWPAYSINSNAVTYTVKHANGESLSSPQNQQVNGGQWNALGSYFFQQGVTYEVIVTGRTDGDVVADAIRISNLN